MWRDEVEMALRKGEEQLGVLKRQVLLGGLYPSTRSVMEGSADMAYKFNNNGKWRFLEQILKTQNNRNSCHVI